MRTSRRKILLLTFVLITILTLLVWAISKYIQPILPPEINSDLVLIMACLIGVVTLLTNIPDIYDRVSNLFRGGGSAQTPSAKPSLHNREIMLSRVWEYWIAGVLKKSLHSEMRLEPGLEWLPDSVENPWESMLQMPKQPPAPIPPGKKILDVFRECSQSLIILGEPGSGKTTGLLELASQAIEAARRDGGQPMPVVFNLSSWTPGVAFRDWLVGELWKRYGIPRKIGRAWVDDDELMLLLDGLDEVKAEDRNACVQALNEYFQQHLLPICICCRKKDFEALEARLDVHNALLIQPLSSKQAVDYLRAAVPDLEDVYCRLTAESTPESLNFIHTPLFISLLILAYRNAPAAETDLFVKTDHFRQKLLDAYIQRMFEGRGKPLFPFEQTRKWLAWLAKRMLENGQSLYNIENLQADWLGGPGEWKRFFFIRLVPFLLLCGLAGGLMGGLMAGMTGQLTLNLVFFLAVGLFGGLCAGVIDFDKKTSTFVLAWSKYKNGFTGGFIFGLLFGLMAGLAVRQDLWPLVGLSYALVCGQLAGLSVGIRASEIELHDRPDQFIRNSIRNSLVFGLGGALIIGLVGWLMLGPLNGALGQLRAGSFGLENILVFMMLESMLMAGIGVGLGGGLAYGGGFLISHFLLRWLLHRAQKLPLRLVPFLDFAAERVLLRKVGGGYIFIHRMIMEHFAAMEKDAPPPAAP